MLLGKLERPALKWLAAKTPAWVSPDFLTVIGFLGSVVVFVGYVFTNRHPAFLWLASLGFIINWLGDSLDGTVARYRNIERPKYGFFVDHTVDALDEMLVFLGLGLSPYVDFSLAILTLLGYMLMTVLAYITTIVSGVFRIA
ncbi:MAG TPA: CDP-alcohol phosphatidyltransferase family protein, partial [Anaerolineaceae bacterium]|nr:CDP-alcohol phosphatidyltransferase family protein [Anaerolineaceae bacterium]